MCLAIPAQITELKDNNMVEVNILGATREASIDLTPTAKVGDYVLVHAGFAIEVVDPEFAEETLELVKQFPEMVAEEVPEAAAKQAV
ncbi:HypC/HybG/HupF family hydrogenase formation chaperone [Hugonella massiliensis]|uniref:HypC/HybG/HupF family hydrogenase formation chaperone n=1 Tax=Hugonella massiliensis TaxID=1720315 RepID=UPI00073ED360|nr:HypC/HybG/HupF family hydrogenase formation chaperone [Hugonella massiliensis]MDD6729478.1 HypC/HybG/HupF family hydrogenase formation chaperone [Eggerthellaceae bacterium]